MMFSSFVNQIQKYACQKSVRMRENAIVIGGNIAGLLAARVPSDHFDEVILIEKDNFVDDAHDKISCNNISSCNIVTINYKLYLEKK